MVSAFYFVTFLLSISMTAINLFKSKKADTRFIIAGIAVTLNCFGRYLISISTTLEFAIHSVKVMYLGGCFIAPIIIIIIVQFCDFKMNKFIKIILFSLATITYAFVLTIGHNGLYYKSVELVMGNGYNYLIKEYGPAHNLYLALMIISALVLIYYIIIAIIQRKIISLRIVLIISLFSLAIIISYLLERIFNSSIEWLSLGYVFAIILITNLFDRFNMYDMTINIAHYVERTQEYGYIVFDNKFHYINSNDFAKRLFPEINNWYVDTIIEPDDSLIYREVISNLESWFKNKGAKKFSVGDIYVEMTISDISYGRRNKIVGCIIEITDRTVESKYIETVESYNSNLRMEVLEKTANILQIKDMLVLGMATMVESRDNSTGGHIKRTSDVVRIFSIYLITHDNPFNFTEDFLDCVVKAAPMHDLGKISVDDCVLRKQGKFTDEEYNEMKKHCSEGAMIVETILTDVEDEYFVNIATNIAHYHHEKWNGKGYPCQLSGTEIPVEARIMALADVFDALVSKRCYKEAFSYDKAFSIIKEDLGEHFDPQLGQLFLECRDSLEELYNQY